MAAILVVHQEASFAKDGALGIFEKMGLKDPTNFIVGNYKIWSWNKILEDENHFIQNEDALLVTAGTPIYKGSTSLSESQNLIFTDLITNAFDFKKVRGVFALLFCNKNQPIQLFTDQAGVQNIYFDNSETIVSTSFLGVLMGMDKQLSINRWAITEVLTTGRLIGPDTLLEEISRLELNQHDKIGDIEVVKDNDLLGFPEISNRSFDETVSEQIENLYKYCEDIVHFGEHYGIDSGLTSGHDSRMILILLKKYFRNFQVHSYWRKHKDLELSVAEQVAKKAKVPLKIVPGKHYFDLTEREMAHNLEQAFLFYDGHVRMHCFFTEAHNTLDHRMEILGDKRLGMNGIGGEQYRNEWHIELARWSTHYFVRYFLGYHLCGRSFTDREFEQEHFHHLKNKLAKKLGFAKNAKSISRRHIQKYLNETYVVSLMGARTNAENKLTHFVTPYIDRQLTREAYKSLPHHGISFKFQQSMIKKMNPTLAAVTSGYGYNFLDGEPLGNKFKYIIKEITPKEVYQNKLDRQMLSKGNGTFNTFISRFKILNNSVNTLRSVKLGLSEEKLTCRPDLMPVYLSIAYFFHFLVREEKVNL